MSPPPDALLLAVPLAPLTAMLAGIAGRRRARLVAWWPVAGTALSVAALLWLGLAQPVAALGLRLGGAWFDAGALRLTLGLRLDALSWTVALLVAAVALAVNVFAAAFMREQSERAGFHAAMSGFAAAMLTLVLADSLVLLFAAWEWVGAASWLLIALRREPAAPAAAAKAFVMTRCGDLALLAGWLLLALLAGSTALDAVLGLAARGAPVDRWLPLPLLLIAVGALTKSAQLPFSAWLPDAMVAQAPVSALLHSATMVAAGAWLLLRLFPLYEAQPLVLALIFAVGLSGALLAALVACVQRDLKRVLAWSTISHLGQTLAALGAAVPFAAVFHLCTHAVFKSALFLAAGSVEHAAGSHRLDRLGELRRRLPLLAGLFAVSALALAEVPPLAGFYSGESVFAAVLQNRTAFAPLLPVLAFVSAFYIARAYYATFERWPGARGASSLEPPRAGELLPVLGLAVAAIVLGAWLAHSLPAVLGLSEPEPSDLGWRITRLAAVVAGICAAVFRVRAVGPAPARIGAAAAAAVVPVRGVERALDRVATGVPALVHHGARATQTIEAALDRAASLLARHALRLAALAHALDQGLDRLGRAATTRGARAGVRVDAIERRGFAAGADRLATATARWARRAQRAQTGPLYAYTAALFVWLLGGVVLLWLIGAAAA